MSFMICEKHKKIEKISSKVITNGYVCMNRYCPDSFKVFCANCKNDHRDHAIKVLSIQDTTFLLERLRKLPFKEPNRFIGETLDVMKKLKLIKEFRKKIDILQKQIQKEALKLIDGTESLIEQYNVCKEGVAHLQTILAGIEKPENYKQFFENSQSLLSNLDYNFKKDKIEYGNAITKEKEDKRRKTYQGAKRKIEEVRDYSMKIIEVILHNSQSDDEEQDTTYHKKHYEVLKNELSLQKDEVELEQEISQLKNSKSTTNKSRIKKGLNESQNFEGFNISEIASQYQEKIKSLQLSHTKTENDLRLKLTTVSSEKENLNRELSNWKQNFQEKRKTIKDLELCLRQNKLQRLQKQKAREEMVNKIIDLWQWKGLNNEDKMD